jgi:hypothetical protein
MNMISDYKHKLKILIDARILEGNIRGMGYFTKQIIEQISKMDDKNEYILFINSRKNIKINLNTGKNFKYYEFNAPIGISDLIVIPFVINFIIKPDVVWFPANNCSPFISNQVKVISTIHDLMFFTQKYKFLSKQFFGAMYRRIFSTIASKKADLINTDTNYNIDFISKFFNISKKKIFCAYGSSNISNDFNDLILHRLGLNNTDYIYTISGSSPNKNLDFMIKSLKIFNSNHNNKYKFVITGVKKLNIGDKNIVLTDYISDAEKNSLLKNCKLFLFLSNDEGFGIPPMEAVSNNCNILLSNIPNLVELYRGYAYFIDISDESVVAKKIDEIIDKKINYNKNDLLNKFSWKNSAKIIMNNFFILGNIK